MNSLLIKRLLKKKYSIALCALLFHLNLLAQDPLLDRAAEFVATNPDETIKIGELLLKNEHYKLDSDSINLLIAQSHYNKGNYDLALQYLFAISEANTLSEAFFETYLLKADILRKLYLHKQFTVYLKKTENIASDYKTGYKKIKHYSGCFL